MRSATILSLLLFSLVLTNALQIQSLVRQKAARLAQIEAEQAGFKPGLLIPFYIYPKVNSSNSAQCIQDDYVKVATSAVASRTIVIVSPNNGPVGNNTAEENLYRTCINYLRSNGVKVVGYIHTKLGWPGPINAYRSYSLATADVDYWYTKYSIDGIFVDETTNNWPGSFDSSDLALKYYTNLTSYILSKNSSWNVVLNPGSPYNNSLVFGKGGNVKSVVFEKPAAVWSPVSPATCATIQRNNLSGSYGIFPVGPWCELVPNCDAVEQLKNKIDDGTILPTQSSVMVYNLTDTSTAGVEKMITDGVNQKMGWFYLTDKPPTWNSLPSSTVWTAMVNKLNSF